MIKTNWLGITKVKSNNASNTKVSLKGYGVTPTTHDVHITTSTKLPNHTINTQVGVTNIPQPFHAPKPAINIGVGMKFYF
jgi:hypothetical protein